jgi:uncharacterized surface protein with fasciclin (FAS1) repeats
VIGTVENDSLQHIQITEDFSEMEADNSRLTLIHAVDSASTVEVILNNNINVEDLGFGESITLELPADRYPVDVVISGESTSIFGETIPLRLSYTRYYTLILLGNADTPEYLLNSISMSDVEAIQSQFTSTTEIIEEVQVSDLNIIETLASRDEFSILVAALEAADEDIINRLGGENQEPVTLIAPTNRAFENLISTIGIDEDTFLSNTQIVSDILMYHTIEDEILSDDFRASAGTSIVTILPENQAFFVTVTNNGTILLNGFVQFIEVDILTSNGVIHVIDDVLLPESALNQYGL